MRITLKIIAVAVVVYGLIVLSFLAAMYQPPERFSRIMALVANARLMMPLMLAVPFEPLWMVARAGHLRVGDMAPDFQLPTVDKSSVVRLSSFRHEKPVVLVFGSYT